MKHFNHLLSKLLFFSIILFGFSQLTIAQTSIIGKIIDTLKVGIAGSEPFVFKDGNRGITLEIWTDIAQSNNWNFKFYSYETVENALNDLKNNDLDVTIGPISITSDRLQDVEFSQPYYNSSISILSLNNELNLWQKIKPFFSFKLLVAVFVFLIILFIVGTLLWLAERKASPEQFPINPIRGIGAGMWLAIVTMSTTGYGDKAPITLQGRIIAGTWMIVSLISATSMVAGIASTLTVSSLGKSVITNVEELYDKKVSTVIGSSSEIFLKNVNAKVFTVNNIDEAIESLKNKEVNAVMYDRPQLLYYLKKHDVDDLYLSKEAYFEQGYGFAFPIKSNLIASVNKCLLKLSEDQMKNRIIDFYFGKH